MGVILDTSFLIALNNSKDINHKSAESLIAKLKNKEFGQISTSDYIFDEYATFLMAKSFPSYIISELGEALLSEKDIKFFRISENIFLQSWQLFKKLKRYSFTDCTTIVLAKEFGIDYIATFDSDFDKVPYIKRVP